MRDFNRVKDNEMSVFVVDSEADGIRAAIAIASKDYQEKAFGYALFDVAATQALGIQTVPSLGDTPDAEVNRWHYDLQQLTFGHLAEVARLIKYLGAVEDIPLPAFRERVRRAVDAGQLDRRQVNRRNLE